MRRKKPQFSKNCSKVDLETLPVETLIKASCWEKITQENPRQTHFHVILPARNEEPIIGRILKNISIQKIPTASSLTIDVISNGTTDNTESEVKKAQEDLLRKQKKRLISSRAAIRFFIIEKIGKAVAVNYGKKQALSDILINVDVDTLPTPNSIAKVYALIKSQPNCVAASIMPRRLEDKRGSKLLAGLQNYYDAITRENGAILGRFYAYKKDLFDDFPEDMMSEDTWLEFTAIDRYGSDSVKFLGQKKGSDVCIRYHSPATLSDYLSQLVRWESSFQHLMRTYPELKEARRLSNRIRQPKKFINVVKILKRKYPEIAFRDKIIMHYLLRLIRKITRIGFIIDKYGSKTTWTSPETDRIT